MFKSDIAGFCFRGLKRPNPLYIPFLLIFLLYKNMTPFPKWTRHQSEILNRNGKPSCILILHLYLRDSSVTAPFSQTLKLVVSSFFEARNTKYYPFLLELIIPTPFRSPESFMVQFETQLLQTTFRVNKVLKIILHAVHKSITFLVTKLLSIA